MGVLIKLSIFGKEIILNINAMGKNNRKALKAKKAEQKARKVIKGICFTLILLAIILLFVAVKYLN
ncbi:MAG: hypothetical protein ACTTKN_11055 [Phocaeicola sp.]